MVARLRGRTLSNAIDLLFEELRRVPTLSTEEIQTRVRAYFQRCLNQALEYAIDFPSDPGVDVVGEVQYLKKRVDVLRGQIKSQGFDETVICGAQDVMVEVGSALPITPDAVTQITVGVARAEIEKARVLAAMLSGLYDQAAPLDPLFIGMSPKGAFPFGKDPQTQPAEPLLSEVAERYFDFHSKNWVQKTAADQRRVLNLIIEVMGGDRPIRSVAIDDFKRVRDALAKLPPNFMKSKANKGKTASQAIAENSDGRCLSVKTQQKYIEMLRQLFNWAMNEGYVEKVPGGGVKVAGAGKGNPADDRDPYSIDQIQAILGSPLYCGHQLKRRNHPGAFLKRDAYFWTFLIAMFSGMRMGEILQLTVSDLIKEGCIWYFNVSEGDDKSLKTKTSRRRVPVHDTLLKVGILDLIDGKAKTHRLFPEIVKGPDGRYSTNFSKWWGRYARAVGFHKENTAFHSTRHNFTDALRAAELPEYINRALLGHVDGSPHGQYGGKVPIEQLKKNLDKVHYPIDFEFLMKY